MTNKNQVAVSGSSTPDTTRETQAIMAVIERVAMSPDADIEKLERMLDMQERVLDRNAKQCFTADLAAMQAELPIVAKNGRGHNNATFAKLEDINEEIRPTLQKYGFAVTFRTRQNEKTVTISAILSHKLGHSEETDLVLPLDTSGSKNAVQAIGSTLSYGKRYALCALLNISTGDDTDGAIAQAKSQKRKEIINNDRLAKAIEKINKGDYSIARLYAAFDLTDNQIEMVHNEVKKAEVSE